MKRLNHAKTLIKALVIASGLAAAVTASARATEVPDAVVNPSAGHAATDAAVDPESVARADFNAGSSITVNLDLADGSSSAPTCLANGGSTGESNNLNAGACTTSGGIPHIRLAESIRALSR
jgi:hypothetical protein